MTIFLSKKFEIIKKIIRNIFIHLNFDSNLNVFKHTNIFK